MRPYDLLLFRANLLSHPSNELSRSALFERIQLATPMQILIIRQDAVKVVFDLGPYPRVRLGGLVLT